MSVFSGFKSPCAILRLCKYYIPFNNSSIINFTNLIGSFLAATSNSEKGIYSNKMHD